MCILIAKNINNKNNNYTVVPSDAVALFWCDSIPTARMTV